MRILLATAVAIAPLMIAAGAEAQVVISNERTTPISTSTANNGAASDIRIGSGGNVKVTTGAAVTVDSDDDLDIDSGGSITMTEAADGATGVLVQGGTSGSVTIGGRVNVTDSLESEDFKDEDKDGDLDGPFAAGTDRHGVRIQGSSPYVGDILVESGGSVTVEGNQSYGLRIQSGLDGSLTNLGAVAVVGNDSYGNSGPGRRVGQCGRGGNGIGGRRKQPWRVSGRRRRRLPRHPFAGQRDRLSVYHSAVGSSRRRRIERRGLYLEDLDADDLLQGGPAFSVQGDVAGGVILANAPAYESADGADGDDDGDGVKNGDEDDDGDGVINREDTDRDGDGIPDTSETNANITSIGGAPAMVVGSTERSVTLGMVGEDDQAFGFINGGTITGVGTYAGVAAHGLQFGVEGGQAVTVEGGVRNIGSIATGAVDADSTALQFLDNVSTPILQNERTIQAGASTDGAHTATAVLISEGANLPALNNSGVISAGIGGNHGDAVAVRDLSGTLTSFTNSGTITAAVTANPDDDTQVDGSAVAIDLSANTAGVTIRQFGVLADEDSTLPDTDGDGVSDINEPSIRGDMLLGSGDDSVSIENGTLTGNLSFGVGADSLAISGGAYVVGAITDADGRLDITVGDGTLFASQTSSTNISNLSVGADGTLLFNVDPAADAAGGFNVSGAANVATGASLGVRFASLLDEPERFTLLTAGELNVGELDQTLLEQNSPYLYVVEAGVDQGAGQLYVDARRRTAEEAGLIRVEASAFDAIYAALGDNETLQNLFLGQTSRDDFIDVYEQMLPDHSGGPLMSLSAGVDAVTRALTGRNASAAPGETSAWVQEINFYADKDKTESYGFRSEGFGVAGGVERGSSLGAFGVSVAFTSSDIEDPEAEAEEILSANLLELGLYWRAQGQYWTTWARAAGGYASFSADRSLVADGVYLNNTSDWHGWTAAAAGGASYERNFGRLNVRPEIYAEYFRLSEDARSETGGGDGFDLDIDGRDSHIFSAVAAMNVGYGFGRNGWIRPELRVGYRQNISVDAGETIARFASGGPDFILTPDAIEGGGPILGFRLNVGNELGMLSITGDAELLEDYVRYSLLLRASFRF
ncbi:autotransporter outer membrane beta-barrel domain-containing protein [Brevundimonas albigilva]|uniref:autotransporter outer membrane beta-barrel domain-containing protein n=1 Tax=Brevundimonas albigilva TaxID=1312364 RepID=UPI00201B778D|nr:autotransporter outer membrane beta-barrel domain-containing protein [Brevundimonas albigilva]UQV18508.1 autotransporter outer membrane beta-barrel domain-containing protein [Brevundimonas albigilva]